MKTKRVREHRSGESEFHREGRRAYLFLVLPALIWYLLIMVVPALFSVLISFSNYSGGSLVGEQAVDVEFVGLANYARMFGDSYFWIALKNNLSIVLVSVFGQIPCGFVVAYILHNRFVKCTQFWQYIIFLPAIISSIIVGILWQILLSPLDGPVTRFVRLFSPGWENTLMNNPQMAIFAVLFVIFWMYTGTYLIIFTASLQKIDKALLESARIDGASELQILVRVILPILSGVIVTTLILAISGSLKSLDLVLAMTGGGPAGRTSVLALYMYNTAFSGVPRYGLANAISTFMMIASTLLILLTLFLKRGVNRRLGDE